MTQSDKSLNELREEFIHLRAQMKADSDISSAVRKAIRDAFQSNGVVVSDEFLRTLVIASRDELGSSSAMGPLPVPDLGPLPT